MSIIMIVVIAVVGAALVAALAVSFHKVRRDQDQAWGHLDEAGIHRGLSLLLRRGYDGAIGIFTDRAAGTFLQFRKYIIGPGSYGIEMHFPRSPWSSPYYSSVQGVLRKHQVEYERISLNAPPTVEVLQADLAQDVDRATRVAADIFREVFGQRVVSVKLQTEDICPLDEVVETKDHPRPTELLRRKLIAARGPKNIA